MIKKLIVLFILVSCVCFGEQRGQVMTLGGYYDPSASITKSIWWNSAASSPVMLSIGTLVPVDNLGCTVTLHLTDDYIKQLAKDGSICKVMGHFWRKTPHLTLEYRLEGDYPEHRICELCGKKEAKALGDWK